MLNWEVHSLACREDFLQMAEVFRTLRPTVGAFDTETTGLHVTQDKPFLFILGFFSGNTGHTYCLDLEQVPDAHEYIKAWHILARTLDVYLGHHVSFDLHMLENIECGYGNTVENLSDTMFYIRFAHDAIPLSRGGPPLGLKDYTTRYVTRGAASHEKRIKEACSAMAAVLNTKLALRLGKRRRWLEDFFKDKVRDVSDLTEEQQEAYNAWLHNDVPLGIQHRIWGIVAPTDVPYSLVDRKLIIEYAHKDVQLTLETYRVTEPVVRARGTLPNLELENSLILPFFEMERTGFDIDMDYLQGARLKLKDYIIQRRAELHSLLGQQFTVGQHKLFRALLKEKFDLDVPSTRDEVLSRLHEDLVREERLPEAQKAIELLQELRTLEKWYSTYIIRFIKDLRRTNKLHTSITQVGTVTMRITSDFQQFPNAGILHKETGQELFRPRRMVKAPEGEYHGLVYLDYSQIELRVQAMYTILVEHPDTNLCRAYMPYKCKDPHGVSFDWNNPAHIKNWQGEWYLDEAPDVRWTPLDVHTATTCLAFGITPDHPDFKRLRHEGKRVNFAKNYGASRVRIRSMFPTVSEEQVTKIDNAYYEAFPGVKEYHKFCERLAYAQAYATNLFGMRYYGVPGHNLKNLLIQGSAACLLKLKIREIYDYTKANNIKSKMQMQVHDELSWVKHRDEYEVFFQFKEILEDYPVSLVPIVAEMDATNTTWADQKGVKTVDELKEICPRD